MLNDIKAGKIKIVSALEDEFNLGAKNNTIIHECVHWSLHRKAFELERCYDLSLSSISTRVDLEQSRDKTTATDWMEWHSRSLTPKIMMPHDMFKREADYLFYQYAEKHGHVSSPDIMEQVIEQLADYFGVSRLSAKIRMVEVAHEEAIDAFNYVDGRYVQAHSWKKGTVEKNQTFCIDAISAAIETFTNPEFTKLVESGRYVYVDSHFILNTPKYVVKDFFGQMMLTEYARHHMDEYLADIVAENEKMYLAMSNDPMDCLEMVLKWRGMTKKALAEKIAMEERQMQQIFKGETNTTIETMVAICLALYLPPEISFHIIEKSNLTFKFNVDSHKWYKLVLYNHVGKNLDETRAFLKKHDVYL